MEAQISSFKFIKKKKKSVAKYVSKLSLDFGRKRKKQRGVGESGKNFTRIMIQFGFEEDLRFFIQKRF